LAPEYGPWLYTPQVGLTVRANALKLLSQQYLKQVVRIESAGEALAGQALSAGLLTQEIERDVAQDGKVFSPVSRPQPTLIFTKGDI
jgi:hypothetical protein